MRLEYINQDKSRIYTDSMKTKDIYAITITPTYNFSKNSYARVEASYMNANKAFQNKQGNIKNVRIYLSEEIAFLF